MQVILGSRSPRRLDLLSQLIAGEAIVVCPPVSADELSFENLSSWPDIEDRLRQIAREKNFDVLNQCRAGTVPHLKEDAFVLTADTVIVAGKEPNHVVLGQPLEADWENVVRIWFRDYLAGTIHRAATAVCLSKLSGETLERVSVSQVRFSPYRKDLVEWYLQTGEPLGKAGGYGIQGAGSVFVSELKGSLSNVIGLPLEDVWEMIHELQFD